MTTNGSRKNSLRDPKTAEHQHRRAWKRLLKRFGIIWQLSELDDLVGRIERSELKLICHQSRRVSIFAVEIEGQTLAAVYDRNRHAVATFLPVSWITGTPIVEPDDGESFAANERR